MSLLERLKDAEFVLLVQPSYPRARKSKHFNTFTPLPLLKFATFLRNNNVPFQLIEFAQIDTYPLPIKADYILITTAFTYWSDYVKETVTYLKQYYPLAHYVAGGIYASLLPEHCLEYCDFDEVFVGNITFLDNLPPAYDLVDSDWQIIHTSRGCIRRCEWCYTYKVEPKHVYLKSIKDIVCKPHIIIYDNNFLANPYIENILDELITLHEERTVKSVEVQSGIDGRLLTPHIASKLKKANFKKITIAWDNSYDEHEDIKKQIMMLIDAGYRAVDLKVFILFNYTLSYNECEKKRVYLYRLGVQVLPMRYVPPTLTYDGYNPHKRRQTIKDYYIHKGWTDNEIRQFFRNGRQHNICIRYKWNYWKRSMETKKLAYETVNFLQTLTEEEADDLGLFNPNKEQKIKHITDHQVRLDYYAR